MGLLSLLFLVVVISGGCTAMKPQIPPVATLEGSDARFFAGQIIDTSSGRKISFDELTSRLSEKKLVFIGETHSNPEHHLIQTQLLQSLFSVHKGSLCVAMESFEAEQQNALDRYLDGIIDEQDFLRESDWYHTWSFDYSLYRPLVLAVKENRARLFGVNAPAKIVKKVARKGLKGLEPGERERLAQHIDLNDKEHRAYLEAVFPKHDQKGLENFEHFYQAQCVWEDTMAENIARLLVKRCELVVVITGSGHIINRFGVPSRTARRYPTDYATVMPYPIRQKEELKGEMADFIWLTDSCSIRRFTHMFHMKGASSGQPAERTGLESD